MYSFTKPQQVFRLGEISFGGQPGEHPTVLFGGVFFKGTPDFKTAGCQVAEMLRLGEQTGMPTIPDVFIRKAEYLEPILGFLEQTLPDNHPFSVDIIDPVIKVKALEALRDHGLLGRTIYNSIHIGITVPEREALKRCVPAMVIVVAFNPKDLSPDGRIEVLENGAHLLDIGLLALVSTLGLERVLVDTAALAPGENSGAALASLPVIKEEYGLPVGCAIHNVVEKSAWLNRFGSAKTAVDAASNAGIALFGGDFAVFGPVAQAPVVVPLMAWFDMVVSEYTEAYFGVCPSERHPRRVLSA
jgi:tetrahydromethanopterin S-methyltransferase subunit H